MLTELFEILATASPNQIKQIIIKELESEGYIVELRGPWETVKNICQRLHISESKFRRRMKRRPRPHPSDIDVGSTGRIVLIRSNSQLDKFLRGPSGLSKIPADTPVRVVLEIPSPPREPIRKRSQIR